MLFIYLGIFLVDEQRFTDKLYESTVSGLG